MPFRCVLVTARVVGGSESLRGEFSVLPGNAGGAVDARFSKVTSDIGGTGVVGICMISKRCTGLLTKDAPGILRVAAHANVSSTDGEGLDPRYSRGHFPSENITKLSRTKTVSLHLVRAFPRPRVILPRYPSRVVNERIVTSKCHLLLSFFYEITNYLNQNILLLEVNRHFYNSDVIYKQLKGRDVE